ncbi:MAG: WhiB family transcriptional regulator [Acidimicrobiia bacterium]|nr:WhiB family transcriptional regulator [Acidimicrobiia bacterium]
MAPGRDDGLDELRDLLRRPAWHAHAACRGHGTALFFATNRADADEARRICQTCPVLEECREAGAGERFGVWGGETDRERRERRRIHSRGSPHAA